MGSRKTSIRHQSAKEIESYLADIASHMRSGRAVVMVGSGFSLNADSKMPQWKDLAEDFYKETGDVKHAQTDVLNLAEEVESISGRGRLNDILETRAETTNPPSVFHERLLRLRWADVFTTNYDTLLERTLPAIFTRKYSVVVDKNELPFQAKPRIIKLHGSFSLKNIRGAKKPYIITREDYRTYPNKNAPLVNTFRQALLENVVCLIGFSGEDPNFLEWIGWVRDQLSESGLNVYLISPSPMRRAQKKLFDRRNVKVLNLSGYDGVRDGDHVAALSKFFEYLEQNTSDEAIWKDVTDFPWENHEANRKNTFEGVKNAFSSLEKQYPGWLIAPFDYQERLRYHVLSGVRMMAQWPDEEWVKCDVDFWYSLASIMHQCWMPLAYIGSFLGRIKEGLHSFLEIGEYGRHASQWVYIAHDLLFTYRYCGQEIEWQSLIALLESKRNMLYELKDKRIDVERIKFQIARGQIDELKKSINELAVDSADIWAKCQKVALLAEFVSPNMAKELAMRTLDELRRGMTANEARDYKLMSFESLLLFYINLLSKGDGIETSILGDKRHFDASTRQFQLKVDNCDIVGAISDMSQSMAMPDEEVPRRSKEFSTRKKFSLPGFSWRAATVPRASSFLMMLDCIGIPLRVGAVPVARDELKNALSNADIPNAYRIPFLLRSGDVKISAESFSRKFLAQMPAEQIKEAYTEVVSLCKYNLTVGRGTVNTIESLLLVIGRMFCRVPCDYRQNALEVLHLSYKSDFRWDLNKALKEVVSLLCEASLSSEILKMVPILCETEIVYDQRDSWGDFERCEHPITIAWNSLDERGRKFFKRKLKDRIDKSFVDYIVAQLIVAESDIKKESWYLAPLVVLMLCNVCTEKQIARILPRLRNSLISAKKYSFLPYDVENAVDLLKEDVSFEGFQRQELKNYLVEISNSMNAGRDIDGFVRIGVLGAFKWLETQNYDIIFNVLERYYEEKAKRLNNLAETDIQGLNENTRTEVYYETNSTLVHACVWLDNTLLIPRLKRLMFKIERFFMSHDVPNLAFRVRSMESLDANLVRDVQGYIRLGFSSPKDWFVFDAFQALCFCMSDRVLMKDAKIWADLVAELFAWIPGKNLNLLNHIFRCLVRTQGLHFNILNIIKEGKKRLYRVLKASKYANDDLDFESKVSVRTYAANLAGMIYAIEGSKEDDSVVDEWKKIAESNDEFSEIKVAWQNGMGFIRDIRKM